MVGATGLAIRMVDVLRIPDLDRRLLSIGKLTERGLSVEFGTEYCRIWHGLDLVAKVKRNGNTNTMDTEPEQARFVDCSAYNGE
jgi:hypothetical protein